MGREETGRTQEETQQLTGFIPDAVRIPQSMRYAERFNRLIFPLSFPAMGKTYRTGSHIDNWANMFQSAPNTCIIAPRRHSKTTTLFSYIMWEIFRSKGKNLEILYVSYDQPLARYQVKDLKDLIAANPFFNGKLGGDELENLTEAESVGRYTWDKGEHIIEINPQGILSAKRGISPDIIILDDILTDPTDDNMMNLTVIKKINRRVKEEIVPITLQEGRRMKIIATPMTPNDFLFDFQMHESFLWGMFPAVINWNTHEVLWQEMYPFEKLMQMKELQGDRGFEKEFMLVPVYTANSYFTQEQIDGMINKDLQPVTSIGPTYDAIVAGWDVGKKQHPAHFSVFILEGKVARMLFQKFMDGWEYTRQLQYIKDAVDLLKIDKVNWDATRGEFDALYEQNMMDKTVFKPVIFTAKLKAAMAAEFGRRATSQPEPLIQLLYDQRMRSQLRMVTNDLQSIETPEGHADAFWSICLALIGMKEMLDSGFGSYGVTDTSLKMAFRQQMLEKDASIIDKEKLGIGKTTVSVFGDADIKVEPLIDNKKIKVAKIQQDI